MTFLSVTDTYVRSENRSLIQSLAIMWFHMYTQFLPIVLGVGLSTDVIYPNGISCTLPEDLQLTMIQTIAGLENAKMLYPGANIRLETFK